MLTRTLEQPNPALGRNVHLYNDDGRIPLEVGKINSMYRQKKEKRKRKFSALRCWLSKKKPGLIIRRTDRYITDRNVYDMCARFLVFTPPTIRWSIFRLDDDKRDGATGREVPRELQSCSPHITSCEGEASRTLGGKQMVTGNTDWNWWAVPICGSYDPD